MLVLVAAGSAVAYALFTFEEVQVVCVSEAPCPSPRLTPVAARTLREAGVSISAFAVVQIVTSSTVGLVSWLVGLLIFLRKRGEAWSLFMAFFLLGYGGLWASILPDPVRATLPSFGLWLIGGLALVIQWSFTGFILFLYLFPDGRFAPRWTRYLVPVAVLSNLNDSFANLLPEDLGGLLPPILVATGLAAQFYRYRRVSSVKQKRQTKWVIYAAVLAIIILVTTVMLSFLMAQSNHPLFWLFAQTCFPLIFALLPLSVGIAILRSQLWDIDLIIRKTAIYALLTLLLTLVYLGSVVVIQNFFTSASGQRSPAALVISTLLIAALFTSLRRRVQNGIDRRFYRRKYDAAQALAAFARTVRDEVELERLKAELLQVVQETVQPESAGVWLKPAGQAVPTEADRGVWR